MSMFYVSMYEPVDNFRPVNVIERAEGLVDQADNVDLLDGANIEEIEYAARAALHNNVAHTLVKKGLAE